MLAAILDHHEHALLALGEEHLVGGHRALTRGHQVEVDEDAAAAAAGHLGARAGEAGGAHVLDADDGIFLEEFEAGLEQQLLAEGVAHLHGRALVVAIAGEAGRGHLGAVDAVAARLGTHIEDGVSDAGRHALEDLVVAADAGREGVDEDVAVVAGVEEDLAAHGRNAHAVAVACDAADDAVHEEGGARVVGSAESERVQRGHRAGAHGEDVAEDAAHAGRCALVGLDEGGVVVRLHLEDGAPAVADVDGTGILAGAYDDLRPGRGQRAQMDAARLVGAVLAPHRAQHANLGGVGLAAEPAQRKVILFIGQVVLERDLAHRLRLAHGDLTAEKIRF